MFLSEFATYYCYTTHWIMMHFFIIGFLMCLYFVYSLVKQGNPMIIAKGENRKITPDQIFIKSIKAERRCRCDYLLFLFEKQLEYCKLCILNINTKVMETINKHKGLFKTNTVIIYTFKLGNQVS